MGNIRSIDRITLFTTTAICALTFTACAVDFQLPAGVEISCAGTGTCPEGYVCNATSARCVPSDRVDTVAPFVTDVTISPDPAFLGPTVPATVTVTVDGPLAGAPTVFFVDHNRRTLTGITAHDPTQLVYQFTYTPDETETELVERPLQIELEDAVGNTSSAALGKTISFDFIAPQVATTPIPEILRLPDPASNPLTQIDSINPDSILRVTFSTTEVVESPMVQLVPATPLALTQFSGGGTSFTYTLDWSGAAGVTGGTFQIDVTLVDAAGNTTTSRLPSSTLILDAVAPQPPTVDVAGAVVLERYPWGADGVSGAELRLVGQPSAVESEAWVIVYADADRNIELVRRRADTNGAFGGPGGSEPLVVPVTDRIELFVAAVDSAGNVSDADPTTAGAQASRVRDGLWVATLGGKEVGESFANPHRFESRVVFDELLVMASARAHGEAGLATVDGSGVSTVGAGSWELANYGASGDTERTGLGAYYDTRRGIAVAYGGYRTGDCRSSDDTLVRERRSGMWTAATTPPYGPGVRTGASLLYQPWRDRALLFGGYGTNRSDANEIFGDTWEWDGERWLSLCNDPPCSDSRPSARYEFALTYDRLRKVAVLFGGYTGVNRSDPSDETWEWTGSLWRLACDSSCDGPSARGGAALVYEENMSESLLFGGSAGSTETWSWDGSRWLQHCTAGECGAETPEGRKDAAMVFDRDRGETVLFGGRFDSYTCPGTSPGPPEPSDTWIWSGSAWTRKSPNNLPDGRSKLGMFYDSLRQRVVITGGERCGRASSGSCTTALSRGETWEWDGSDWTQILNAATPPASSDHSAAWDGDRGGVIIYGADLGDTWLWNGRVWSALSSSPITPVLRPALASYDDGTADTLVCIGGRVGSSAVDQVCEWGAGGWTACGPATPGARHSHGAATYGTGLLMHGGRDGSTTLADTWILDGSGWQERCTAGDPCTATPGTLRHHGMARTANAGEVLLFGGQVSGSAALSHTWLWTGGDWVEQSPATIPDRRGEFMITYDEARRAPTMSGGVNGWHALSSEYTAGYEDVWEWNGADWARATIADPQSDGGPAAIEGGSFAYDPVRGETVLYGGDRADRLGGTLNDTWIWHSGAVDRPGQVFYPSLAASGLEENVELTDLQIRWVADGVGYPAGVTTPGLALHLWTGDRWEQIGTDASGNMVWSSSAASWPLTDLNAILLGPERALAVAATPAEASGAAGGYASIDSDYVEVGLRYRLP